MKTKQFTLLTIWHVFARIVFYLLYRHKGFEKLSSSHVLFYPIFSRFLPFYDFLSIPGREPNVTKFVMRIQGILAVDIGASLGEYTLRLAPHFKRVLAIEPNPVNFRILSTRLKQRKISNVVLIRTAVADRNGITKLFFNPGNPYGGASLLNMGSTSIRVHSKTLDSLLRNEDQVDLVKVDAEGAEWLILKGSQHSIPKIKRWMIALHDVSRQRELNSLLRAYGYVTRWVGGKGPRSHVLAFRAKDRYLS